MAEINDRMTLLVEKLNALMKREEIFSREIRELGDEINRLKNSHVAEQFEERNEIIFDSPENGFEVEPHMETVIPVSSTTQQEEIHKQPIYSPSWHIRPPEIKSDIEKFIGENLINKIGIAITIIGVAIGAKYSIDHDLISPLTRIMLGYVMGIGLLGIGIKLKKNYENYSAVLVSGAIAILYFITYFAYSLYALMPQSAAFSLMVVFTAFTVATAINYNRQVIAHIGMVGAYAVPFLLSESSGKVAILFSYIAIINIGILLISFKKYWKPIYYASFLISWLIYFSWFSEKFKTSEYFELALISLIVFFVTFYAIFLAYKLLKREKFNFDDVFLLLANSFIFYGIGYSILKTNETGAQLLGAFTVCNALIHFTVCFVIYSQKLADRILLYLVAGLALVFITIAIPVQFDGNWVTLLWAGEAALLFWIGRTKNIQFYEMISYALILLTFFSIIHDWTTVYDTYIAGQPETRIYPFFNISFLTSLFVITSFGSINILHNNHRYPTQIISHEELWRVVSLSIPAFLLIVLYYSIRIEIATYWNQLYIDSKILVERPGFAYSDSHQNTDLLKFQVIWIINYSLLFMSLLSFMNIKKLKNFNLGLVNLVLNTVVVLVFLIQGLHVLDQLKESYLNQPLSEYYQSSSFNIGLRYISFTFLGLTLFSIYKYCNQDFIKKDSLDLRRPFDCLFYITILWIASSELITWMDILKFSQSSKLGLSILWGVYALLIIVLGIWKKKKHLRIGAIVLFALTLYKLFFYDILDLDTIAKTIVFVSLGMLLLIISFLYNKYKHIISN